MNAIVQAMRSRSAIALLDQGVVSAGGFVVIVVLGRWADPAQLGVYSLAASILWLFIGANEALITRPYAIQINKPTGSRENHALVSLALNIGLGLTAACALMVAALAFFLLGSSADLSLLAIALAFSAPFVLIREFARRHAMANLKVHRAFLLDLIVVGSSLAVLASVVAFDVLSAATAIIVLGASCAIGAAWWLAAERSRLGFALLHVRATMERSWRLGRWFLSGTIAVQMQGYAVHWLSFAFLGAATTGVYAACLSIVAFSNPIVFGFINIMTPQSVEALHEGGTAGLRRQALRATLTIGAAVGAFCVFIGLFGNLLMGLLYPAPEYQGVGGILLVLALSVFAGALGVPAGVALASLERARALAAITIATAGLTISFVWMGVVLDGLFGAALGLLAGETIGSMARWIAFLFASRSAERSEGMMLAPQPRLPES
ncbi:MAG: lipopolysaccharide biosynthesis protein [Salinarimonadaceae bacterium]|nr:MAG: lipopolysaccharide biosynthesis protein [Salinarimonadaceae bacterium]